ncbi:MAG: hypothetical protein ACREER_08535 [Alphaproteobacteria bacterium]
MTEPSAAIEQTAAVEQAAAIEQAAAVDVRPGVPLVVCDADEVLFDFMTGFEAHLAAAGLVFTWQAFRLNGNLRRRADGRPLPPDEVKATVTTFFEAATEDLAVIAGAASGLAAVAGRAQIVVLSNMPPNCREARLRAMAREGMAYPLIANQGPKGPVVHALARRADAPTYFIDDSPTHHADVARLAPEVTRIHFIGHPRLARLIGLAPDGHVRPEDWPGIVAFIAADLERRGY